jgi:hypothetical protein
MAELVPATHLHTYVCPRCKPVTVLTTPVKSDQPWHSKCRYCHSWMKFGWTEPITTDAQRDLAKRGVVFMPYEQLTTWTCVRCDEVHTGIPHFRADGFSCDDCYYAEAEPPVLLTAEEIEARKREREQFRRDMDERHERAHSLTEQEQR